MDILGSCSVKAAEDVIQHHNCGFFVESASKSLG